MASNPSAIANALAAQTQSNASAGALVPGISPLAGGYNQWISGSQTGPGLPKPMLDFLTGAFGPLSPLTPMPIDTSVEDSGRPSPRRFQYPIGWNIPIGQPGTEGLKLVNFQALRRYADLYSVVRAMLNIRENETAGLTWDVGPTADAQAQLRDDPDRKNKRKDQHDRSAQIVQWFKRIDSNYKGFQSWFQAALEEQFVIDALSLYIAPPRVQGKGLFGSDIAELQLIAGDTVRPLLDIRGSTPRPPAPAYQQYLWGVPRVDLADVLTGVDLKEMAEERGIDLDKIDADEEYRADQMLYLPRLKRTWTPYGFSPIEQAVMPITIGMNRQSFLLDYFTEGTIPGVYVVAGDSLVTPAQQQQLQSTLNALAGDIAWKHRVIVLPPGSKTDPQKDMTWQAQIDSSIVEQVGMILHIQPHEIGMMPGGRTGNSLGGSGQASQQQESVTAERTEPDRKWWKETTFDWIIQRVMNQEDLEFKWVDFDESEDDEKKSAARKSDISIGRLSIDETRIEDGLDPWGTPYTSSPVVMLGAQVVPLDPSIPAIPAAPAGAGGPSAPDGTPLPTGHQMHPDGVHMIPPAHKLLPDGKSVVDPKGAPVPTDKLPEAPKGGNPFAKPNPFGPAAGAPGAPPANAAQTPAVGAPAAGSAKPGASTAAPVKAKPKAPAASAARNAAPRGTAAKPKKAKAAKITVADLVKGKVRYKGNLTPIVYRYLLRSYPADAVDWVNQKGADWEFEPHVKLSDINMARRPGGRDPDKVESIGNTLDDGASMDPIVLIERQDQSQYKYDIADGWHRCLGAEKAGWDDVPAFIGEGFDDKSDWGLQMQDESDSVKKAAQAELSVLRRYLKKGGDLARFRTNALDSDALWFVADGITKLGVDGAIERGRAWVDKAGGNPDALREWYNSGADGQIDWGSDGDFEACVGVASAYMDSDQARGFCQLRHMDATGETTSEHAAEDKVLKDISLSSPLGTGLVPYDLAGSAPSPATDTCPMCGARKGDDGKCLNGHVLKYSDDEARDEHGRWIAAGGGVDRHVTVEDTRTKTVPAEYDDLTAATVHLRTTGAQIGRVHQYSSAELNDYRSTGSGTHFVRAWGAHDDQGKRLGNGFTNKKSAVEDVTRAWNVKVRGDSYYPGPSWRRTTTSGKVASPDLTLLEAVEAELLRRGVDIAKYSDAQPRDDHGRWTSGGDTSGGATGHGPNETITKFMRPDGTWDPARVAEVHNPALARLTDGVKVVDGAPTVYMTGGGYGSGKSSIVSSPVVGFPQGKDAVHVDPDALKADIPEYRATANTDPMAATNAHEESSYLAKQGVALGLAGNHDVVYDTSGDTDPDRLAAKIAGFRALGAGRVEGDYAFPGTVEEAQARADARAANSDGLRRYVPPDLLSANHAEVSRVWQAAADRGTYDTLRLWSTAGPLGSQPSLIAEAAGGKTTVHDPVQFAAFKAIGAKGA